MTTIEDFETFHFSRFVLQPDRRVLRRGEVPVALGARAFDILVLLVRHRDRVVTKDEILAAVWRGTVVEENNLAVHVSAIRRALGERPGERFIATVSGLGYRFVGAVSEGRPAAAGVDNEAHVPGAVDLQQILASPVISRKARWPLIAALAGAAMLVIGVARYELVGRSDAIEPPRLSMAVLPFRDLGGGPDEYLADAVTDDLTTDLSHVPESTLIARDSAETFRGKNDGPIAIGHALGVRYLIEGSLLADGTRLHVDAHLIDARQGVEVWADTIDVDRADVADRLEETVSRISGALRVRLVLAAESRPLRHPRRDGQALDLYLRARSLLDRSDRFDTLVTAQGLLEKAAAIEPGDGAILAELGLVLVRKMGDFDDPDEVADYERAVVVTRNAAAQAPGDPLALAAEGMLAWVDDRCKVAEPVLGDALLLDANDLQARDGQALCARQLGHFDEMIADFRDILRVDPVGAENGMRETYVGMGLLMLGKPGEAISWLRRAGADESAAASGWGWRDWRRLLLIAALEQSGDRAQARRELAEFERLRPDRSVFQLSHYVSRIVSVTAGWHAFLQSLHEAGMTLYPPEADDAGVSPTADIVTHGEFDPTPMSIPGGRRVDTHTVMTLVRQTPAPLVVDVSVGASVMRDAIWVSPDDRSTDLVALLKQREGEVSPDRTIIVMSYSAYGWEGYNAGLELIGRGFRNVLWYRGGEAGWVEAGGAVQDRRQF